MNFRSQLCISSDISDLKNCVYRLTMILKIHRSVDILNGYNPNYPIFPILEIVYIIWYFRFRISYISSDNDLENRVYVPAMIVEITNIKILNATKIPGLHRLNKTTYCSHNNNNNGLVCTLCDCTRFLSSIKIYIVQQ